MFGLPKIFGKPTGGDGSWIDLENIDTIEQNQYRWRDHNYLASDGRLCSFIEKKLLDIAEKQDTNLKRLRRTNKEVSSNCILLSCADSSLKITRMKNKRLRTFYERQNRRLDDCLEVKTLVQNVVGNHLGRISLRTSEGGELETPRPVQGTRRLLESYFSVQQEQVDRSAKIRSTKVSFTLILLVAIGVAVYYSFPLTPVGYLVVCIINLLYTGMVLIIH